MAATSLLILFTYLLLLTTVKSEQLPAQDAFIKCQGIVPNHAHGLPRGYNTEDYFNVMQLCSAKDGNVKNVGCACVSSNPDSLYCFPAVADPILYNARLQPSGKSFRSFCYDHCECVDIDIARAARDRSGNARGGQRTNQRTGGADVTSTGGGAGAGSASGSGQTLYDPESAWESPGPEAGPEAASVAVSHGQCWNNCTSNADCAKVGEKGCMCSTRSEQYQPGSGTVAFVAACIMSMAGGGGKREVAGPCPCNATYVSHACCGSADGMVWEEERFKLGELLLP